MISLEDIVKIYGMNDYLDINTGRIYKLSLVMDVGDDKYYKVPVISHTGVLIGFASISKEDINV